MNVSINVPPEVKVLNGTPLWSTSLGPDQNETHALQINRTSFGTSILETSFTYKVGETEAIGPINLQQMLAMIPRVGLEITAPQETLLWMQHYQINLTIANLDPFAVTVDLKPSTRVYTQEGDVITLTLNPLANTTLYPRVKIKGSSIGYAVFFEEIRLDWATALVNFTYPDIWIGEIFIDNNPYNLGYVAMEVGKMHTVQSTIRNEENASYSVTIVLKEGSYSQQLSSGDVLFAPNYSTQAAELQPNSNKTITFHIFALDKPEISRYATLSLAIEVYQTYLRGTEVSVELVSQPKPFPTPEIILFCVLMFFIGVFAKIVYDILSRKIESTKKGATGTTQIRNSHLSG